MHVKCKQCRKIFDGMQKFLTKVPPTLQQYLLSNVGFGGRCRYLAGPYAHSLTGTIDNLLYYDGSADSALQEGCTSHASDSAYLEGWFCVLSS